LTYVSFKKNDESLVCINRVVRSFGMELSSSEAQVVLWLCCGGMRSAFGTHPCYQTLIGKIGLKT
jgi:hypothetical protein